MTTQDGHVPSSHGTLLDSGAFGQIPGASPQLRVVLGLADDQVERRLREVLGIDGSKGVGAGTEVQAEVECAIVGRCVSADQLGELGQRELADLVVVSEDLHRLTRSSLIDLIGRGIPVVLLVSARVPERFTDLPVRVVSVDALWTDPSTARDLLLAAARRVDQPQAWLADVSKDDVRTRLVAESAREEVGPPWKYGKTTAERDERSRVADTAPESRESAPGSDDAAGVSRETGLAVFAVTSGSGSPGRTTLALNLAAALGAVAPTVLVDADLGAPSLAACLDLDPSRNLAMLAHADPRRDDEWDLALLQELQALDARSPFASVLCGVPKPELISSISGDLVERLLAALRLRYRYVILDLGPFDSRLTGPEATIARLTLGLGDQVLLVADADLLGIWRAQTALRNLRDQVSARSQIGGTGDSPIALVVNRHDRSIHQGRAEVEFALQAPVAAIVPFDRRAVQKALSDQRPLLLQRGSPAARAILDLAERAHGGSVRLPPEPGQRSRFAWLHLPSIAWPRLASPWRGRREGNVATTRVESPGDPGGASARVAAPGMTSKKDRRGHGRPATPPA